MIKLDGWELYLYVKYGFSVKKFNTTKYVNFYETQAQFLKYSNELIVFDYF